MANINELFIIYYGLGIQDHTRMCITVKPERIEVTYTNEKYLEDVDIRIIRYGRRSPYLINVQGRNKHTWTNNVTLHIVFYEFLHNEYRRSFAEGHYRFCDILKLQKKSGWVLLEKYGLTCPFVAKFWHFENMTGSIAGFPYIFPFEKARANITLAITDTEEVVFDGYICCEIKPDKQRA
ncbi:hypothetical protein K1T71_003664 [Dendrolimus kikuchii]|uniref:Uncharacterized protein n=1 Tax=Dendrolimus kikuchii TaxID=765133 RepID=A0ACC1D8V4_9NEOP|nr:hypothetical protein K1T71_003664 [Dendrolimus kikuchii]